MEDSPHVYISEFGGSEDIREEEEENIYQDDMEPDMSSHYQAGDHSDQPHTPGVSEGHHACKYCEKVFTTHTNQRRHEYRVHENQLELKHVEKTQLPQEENLHRIVSESSQQQPLLDDSAPPVVVVENEGEHEEHYMLDVSSNISENLSFYIDGKIVSTSTESLKGELVLQQALHSKLQHLMKKHLCQMQEILILHRLYHSNGFKHCDPSGACCRRTCLWTYPTPQFSGSIAESVTLSTSTSVISDCPTLGESNSDQELSSGTGPPTTRAEEATDGSVSAPETSSETSPSLEKVKEDESSNDVQQQTFAKNFICNVCDKLFHSMKELSHHVGDHADEWPYKCEFCVLLFGKPSALLDHRSSLHGVGKTYVCSACTKEFVYLCNLKQHQDELHPGQQCTYMEEEKGKLRPQNYNNSAKVNSDPSVPEVQEEPKKLVKKEESEVDVTTEELLTTIKVMASDGGKIKGPDVRLGINQHYPSFKPPPFPYHNRSPTGSLASATNFTTHNIPQTFSTAIRCTKCGKSFDNMPELHKHILACANASDKRRYTPRKNPIPLRHFAKSQNGVLSTTNSTNGLNASNRVGQSNRSKPSQESPVKFKVLNKRKKKFAQRVMPQRHKSVHSSNKVSPAQVDEQQEIFVCPHCSREFTMRRSRTKHMAVCPKKPKEIKKRKEGGISVTKENDGHLHRGVSYVEEKQASPLHKTRLQTSASTKRPAILPVQTVFSNKRSKIIIKESTQPKQEPPTLNELPIVRTFNPSMRQYSRVQHSVKGVPIKITIVKPQQTSPQKDELPPTQRKEEATGSITSSTKQSALA
ncbi:PR domain zinc finger protein 2 [Archocentrus centrarchus]|uniref:PR domain zinc finger protein 2 n=1 Tax=Archocentrus centrarchus TaxID=63155 RepID=UPI0011EA3918|nr:PR domain zinc finger protein 2-like [Archocentrus centrarchus]